MNLLKLINEIIHLSSVILGGFHYLLFKHPFIGDIWGEKLYINKSDIVLEIGPGYNPSVRSDILLEKFISDISERRYVAYIPRDRKFVVGDACFLPFVNNAVDYIICKHVIEHLDDPALMLEEFKRVSKKGFISAPCASWESMSAGSYHKWFISCKKNTLILERKRRRKDRSYYNKLSREHKSKREIKYEYGVAKSLKYRIINKTSEESFIFAMIDSNYDINSILHHLNFPFAVRAKLMIKSLMHKLFFRSSTKFKITNLLACPICKCSMKKIRYKMVCNRCGLEYVIKDNIPILLKEKAVRIVDGKLTKI